MPNLDPWINQNQNNDYEDTTTKTMNKFKNHFLSNKPELKKTFNLTHILPIMNVIKRAHFISIFSLYREVVCLETSWPIGI